MLLALLLIQGQNPVAAKSSVRHFLNVGGQGGFSFLGDNSDLTTTNIGGTGGAFFQYELNYRRFIFNIGIEGDYLTTKTSLNGFETYDKNWNDGYSSNKIPDEFKFKYNTWSEKQKTVVGYVPINFGMYFTPYVYGLVGAKVGYRLNPTYESEAKMHTEAYYERFYQWITDSPGTWCFPETNYSKSGKLDADLNIAMSFEIGGRIPLPKHNMNIRIGAFCDYGLSNHNQNKGLQVVDYSNVALNRDHGFNDKNDPAANTAVLNDIKDNLQLNSIVKSEQFSSTKFHNITCGVKVTFQFLMPTPGVCICDPSIY